MKTVKIAEAKAHLSRYLDQVRQGGRVRIMNRETPVADLVPVGAEGADGDEDRLLALQERRGILRRGRPGPWPRELFKPGPRVRGKGALNALLRERRQSR